MKGIAIKLWSLGLLMSAPLSWASAAPEVPVPPAGRWVVDWGDFHCSLYRQSGGASPATFAVEWTPGTRQLDVRWINTSWDSRSRPRGAALFLEPRHVRVSSLEFVSLQRDQGIGSTDVDYSLLDRLAAAASIRLEERGRLLQEMALPEAAKAVAALRQCNDTALREWGVDPAALAALRAVPKAIGRPGAWVTNDDYPSAALDVEASGTVVVRLTVGANGRVTDCAPVRSSGNADLDAATCRLYAQRGRFEPAIGPDGAPAAAPVFLRLVWTIL